MKITRIQRSADNTPGQQAHSLKITANSIVSYPANGKPFNVRKSLKLEGEETKKMSFWEKFKSLVEEESSQPVQKQEDATVDAQATSDGEQVTSMLDDDQKAEVQALIAEALAPLAERVEALETAWNEMQATQEKSKAVLIGLGQELQKSNDTVKKAFEAANKNFGALSADIKSMREYRSAGNDLGAAPAKKQNKKSVFAGSVIEQIFANHK